MQESETLIPSECHFQIAMASSVGCPAAHSFCPEYRNDTSLACRGVNDGQTSTAMNGEGAKEDLYVPQSGTETSQERCSSRQKPGRDKLQWMAWLRLQAVRELRKEPMCEKHQEPLNIFCKEDCAFLCLVCNKSGKHRTHTVLPLEEAAQDYKKEIEIRLQSLKEEKNAVQRQKLIQEKQTAEHLEELKGEKEKIVLEFQCFRLSLEEQENLLLAQLSELEKKVVEMQEENSTKFCDTFSHLDDLISDLEKNYQQPASEFLQDLKKTLSWCEKEKFSWPVESTLDQEKELIAISKKRITLTEKLEAFKETLAVKLKREKTTWLNSMVGGQTDHSEFSRPLLYQSALKMDTQGDTKVNVTLDPRTANPHLLVSLDRKSVRHIGRLEVLPDNPERFDTELFVLGCEGFCSGRHCWVVNVEQGRNWAVGIAMQSVKRKGYISLSPEQGIWAVEQCWGQFKALTSHWTSLSLFGKPRRIQVSLDYERGLLAFFDADMDVPVFSFSPISFKHEKIYPWLWVGPGSHLSICF